MNSSSTCPMGNIISSLSLSVIRPGLMNRVLSGDVMDADLQEDYTIVGHQRWSEYRAQ